MLLNKSKIMDLCQYAFGHWLLKISFIQFNFLNWLRLNGKEEKILKFSKRQRKDAIPNDMLFTADY